MKKNIIAKIVVVIVFLYLSIGFILLPKIINNNIIEYADKEIGAKVSIKSIYFNPITFYLEINNLNIIKNKSNIGCNQFQIQIQLLPLIANQFEISTLIIDKLKIQASISKDGKLSLLELLPTQDNKADNTKGTDKIGFMLDKLKLNKSSIHIIDNQKNTPYLINIDDLNIDAENISDNEKFKGRYKISTNIQNDTSVSIKGSIYEMSKVYGMLQVKNMKIKKYFDYVKSDFKFDIKDGIVDCDIGFELNNNLKISNSDLTISSLKLTNQKTDNKTIQFDIFGIKNLSLNKNNTNNIKIDQIFFTNLNIDIIKNNEKINIVEIFKTNNNEVKTEQKDDKNSKTPKIYIKNIDINNAKFSINDKAKSFVNSIDEFNLHMSNIDFDDNTSIKYSATSKVFNGIFDTTGNIKIKPTLKMDLDYNLNDLNINILNNYLTDFVNFKLNSALIYSYGNIKLEESNTTNIINTDISLLVKKFDLAMDNQKASLVRWDNLEFSHCLFSNKSNSIKLNKISLVKPNILFKINKDKSTNFDNLIKTKKTDTNSSSKNAMKFKIDKISLHNGNMDFSDASLPLFFATKIHTLQGDIKRFSSVSSEPTDILLTGDIDEYGYAKIKGKFDPTNPSNNTNIKVKFENLALNSLSPYSGKFVGRAIDEGKVTVKLKYEIVKHKVQGSNKIVISQIKLGKDIESKDASSIPLGFAIALLEDKDGIIDLNLEVTGDTENPKFNINKVIWKTFKNIIVKIVTSPFSALGDMFGFDVDKVKNISFEANSSIIIATQKEKLDKLIGILQDRPKLDLIINKTYHTIEDKRAKQSFIATELIESIMKEKDIKYNKAVKKTYISIMDNLKIDGDDEYDKIKDKLEKRYQDELDNDKLSDDDFDKLVSKELLGELTKKIDIPTKEYESLAIKRQQNIIDYFIKKGIDKLRVKPDSHFTITDKIDKSELDEYVDLEIKLFVNK